MNREIKFRAWDKSFKIMSKPFYSVNIVAQDQRHGLKELQEDSKMWALMQFTGLKDKNGVEIYEGDIVRVNDTNQYGKVNRLKYTIEWLDGSFMCMLKNTKYKNVYPKSMKNQPNMEVIGNIYENPDLI